jgi:hypothetical protein
VPNKPSTVIALLRNLQNKHGLLECVYEASSCAYTLYCQWIAVG